MLLRHGALCPVDVVKTRMQLDPAKYNSGMVGGFKKVIAEEGMGALATGLGPTAVGYFVQGWFKFGGVEFFKINMAAYFGDETAWAYRTIIYLMAAALRGVHRRHLFVPTVRGGDSHSAC